MFFRCLALAGGALADLALPPHLAGLEVDVVDHPAVRRRRRRPVAQIEPGLRRFLLRRVDHGRQEDVIAPDDRRAPSQAGNRRLPRHVLGGAPGVGQRRVVGADAGGTAAEHRPLVGDERDGRQGHGQQGERGEPPHGSSAAILHQRVGSRGSSAGRHSRLSVPLRLTVHASYGHIEPARLRSTPRWQDDPYLPLIDAPGSRRDTAAQLPTR